MNLNGDWPDSWPEVEESVLVGAEPFCNISAVGHGSWQSDHSDFRLFVHPANDNFQYGSSFLPKQMNFIKNNQTNLFGVLSVFWSGDSIPFLRSCHYDISLVKCLNIGSKVAAQLNNRFLDFLHSWNPVFQPFSHQWFQRCHINAFLLRMRLKKVQYCKLTHYGLATSCRCTDQNVLFSLVKGEKQLSLDWIKEVESWIQRLKNWVFKGRFRQGFQREQISKLEEPRLRTWHLSKDRSSSARKHESWLQIRCWINFYFHIHR